MFVRFSLLAGLVASAFAIGTADASGTGVHPDTGFTIVFNGWKNQYEKCRWVTPPQIRAVGAAFSINNAKAICDRVTQGHQVVRDSQTIERISCRVNVKSELDTPKICLRRLAEGHLLAPNSTDGTLYMLSPSERAHGGRGSN